MLEAGRHHYHIMNHGHLHKTYPIQPLMAVFVILFPICHGWSPGISPSSITYLAGHTASSNDPKPVHLKEPDNQYGRMTYWDDSYRRALTQPDGNSDANVFSWYCDWEDLQPFFNELVPSKESSILIPGIGNDECIRGMFDNGYRRLTAFDYAPEGVECAKRIMGHRVQLMDDLRVADGRDLPYENSSFDAVFDKGTLDSIYLSGGNDKELARKHLGMAVSELARTLKPGGVVFSVTAACVNAIQNSFDDANIINIQWEQLRDGSLFMTEDGYTSNNVDATILVWRKI